MTVWIVLWWDGKMTPEIAGVFSTADDAYRFRATSDSGNYIIEEWGVDVS